MAGFQDLLNNIFLSFGLSFVSPFSFLFHDTYSLSMESNRATSKRLIITNQDIHSMRPSLNSQIHIVLMLVKFTNI